MNLPKNERTFEFCEKGDVTFKEYKGSFTVKCVLSMLDKRILEVEKSRIMADISNPTNELIALSTIMANLNVRIIESPSWWKEANNGNNIQDENIIVTLFDKVMDQEEEWRKEVKNMVDHKEGN